MMELLSWILNIMWKAALVTAGLWAIRALLRNGGGTIRLMFETTILAIKFGCLNLKMKLIQKLKEKEIVEVQELEPCDDHDGIAAEGTVR